LILTTFDVTFTVTDGTDPIENATITLTGYGDLLTDASGIAIFTEVAPENDITYSVIAAGFIGYNGTVSVVDSDVNESVILSPAVTSYNVTFTVTDGTTPIVGATITLTGYGTQTTDSDGVTIFYDVSPGVDIPYNSSASGYDTFYGFVTVVDEDIEESVTLFASSYNVTFEISNDDVFIEGALVELDGYGSQITDNSGKVLFNNVFPDLLDYSVSAVSYIDVFGSINVIDEDIEEYVLIVPTNILTSNEFDIKIYPNPTKNSIAIENVMNKDITILSKRGVILKSIDRCTQYTKNIDVSDFESGIYFIKIDNKLHKFVKLNY